MRKTTFIPQPCDTSEARVVDLTHEGLPFLRVFAHTHYSRPDPGTTRHRHDGFIEVLFCRRGDRTVCDHEGKEIDFRPGDVFVAQPERRHFLKTRPKGFDMYWLWIKLADNGRQFPHLSATESHELLRRLRALPVRFTGGDRVRQAFKNIWKNYDDPTDTPLRTISLRLAVYDLLLGLVEAATKPEQPHTSGSLEALLAEMQEHPERPYPADELSRRIGVNTVYLNRLFKRAIGLPPHAYLKSLRIEQAKKLLSSTNLPIATIAHRLGYPSSQHFATQFHQETNLTPTAWRQL